MGRTFGDPVAREACGALAGDASIADGNYHETLDLRLERADTVVALDMPWWLCAGRAFLRGFRKPGELPEGCDYSAWLRLRDEWRLAVLSWRNRRTEPEREREIISQHGKHAALYVLRSKRAVREFLDGPSAGRLRLPADDGAGNRGGCRKLLHHRAAPRTRPRMARHLGRLRMVRTGQHR